MNPHVDVFCECQAWGGGGVQGDGAQLCGGRLVIGLALFSISQMSLTEDDYRELLVPGPLQMVQY